MGGEWRNLSALVVGYGSIGRRHARVLGEIGLSDIRVAEPDETLRSQAAQAFGAGRVFESYEQGLESSPNTVFICTPTAVHVPQALEAVGRGMDVLVEKPLGLHPRECQELAHAADDAGAIVMPAHCFRFHEGLLRAKSWLRAGRIGRVISVRGIMGEYIPEPMPNYLNMAVSRCNGAYELMHDIDIAIWFAGQKPERVVAIDGSFGGLGMEAPDLAETLIRFPDRAVASVHLDFFERARHRQTEVFGERGTVIVEFASWDVCHLSLYCAEERAWTQEEIATERDDMFRDEDRAFLECVVSRTRPPVTAEEGALAVAVVEASKESSRTGRAVDL